MTTITNEQIDEAYGVLAEALRVAQVAAEDVATARLALDAARAALISAGTITGKNEAEREAGMRQKLANNYTGLEAAERRGRETRHWVELARLVVEALRMKLRVAELAAREEV
jgi:hypothetical protein